MASPGPLPGDRTCQAGTLRALLRAGRTFDARLHLGLTLPPKLWVTLGRQAGGARNRLRSGSQLLAGPETGQVAPYGPGASGQPPLSDYISGLGFIRAEHHSSGDSNMVDSSVFFPWPLMGGQASKTITSPQGPGRADPLQRATFFDPLETSQATTGAETPGSGTNGGKGSGPFRGAFKHRSQAAPADPGCFRGRAELGTCPTGLGFRQIHPRSGCKAGALDPPLRLSHNVGLFRIQDSELRAPR